jgi:hypothetical protein
MSDQTASKENVLWLRVMAGPICFAFFAALVYLYAEHRIDPAPPGQLGAGFWPKMCLVGIFLAAGFKAFELYRSIGQAGEEGGACKEMDNFKLALMMLLIVLVVAAIGAVGFPIASFLFFWFFLSLAGVKKTTTLFLVSFFGTIGILYVFVKVVYIPLPRGEWFFNDITLLIYRALFII